MSSPFQGSFDSSGTTLTIDPDEGKIQLTPEEIRILKQCNKEGIQKRGIPLGIAFGVISHLAASQKGILNHPKWGTIPIVLSSAFVGYFSGRLSYFPVCYERLMSVPNGVVRQRALRGVLSAGVGPQPGPVPVQPDPGTFSQSRPTDIDVLSTSNFDTMPSNLDSDTPQLPAGPTSTETPQRYTTYDELRERNRREYMEKMQRAGYSQAQSGFEPGYSPVQPGYPPPKPGYSTQSGYSSPQPGYPPPPPGYQEPMLPPGQPEIPLEQPQIPPGQPTYQRRTRLPVQFGDPDMTPTQESGPLRRRAKTKYGDEWEY